MATTTNDETVAISTRVSFHPYLDTAASHLVVELPTWVASLIFNEQDERKRKQLVAAVLREESLRLVEDMARGLS